MIYKYFLPFHRLPFHFVDCFLLCRNTFVFKLNSSPRDLSCFLTSAVLFIMASKGENISLLTQCDSPESFSMINRILGH